MSGELIRVATFDNSVQAHIAKGRLIAEGMEADLEDEYMIGLNPLYNQALGGIKLVVPTEFHARAIEVLNEIENSDRMDSSGEPIECPSCKSRKLYSGFKSVKSTRGLISILFAVMFIVYPIYFDYKYRCKKCGKEFRTR